MDFDIDALKNEIMATISDVKDLADDTLFGPEAVGIGAGLIAAGLTGYSLHHPEIAMYLAAEAGDIAQEIASEIGGLTSAVEVGGD